MHVMFRLVGGMHPPSPPKSATGLQWLHLLRISTSFTEESEEKSSFLWLIISCSLIGLLIIAVRNFQTFSIAALLVHLNLFLS